METFGQALNRIRGERSLREVARLANLDDGHLYRVARGTRAPTEQVAVAIDRAFKTGGELAALVAQTLPHRKNAEQPFETAELLGRLRANSVDLVAVEAMHATVDDLCCDYPTREAAGLRAEAHDWLREITRLTHKPVGVQAHKELLLAAGWLALLAGCLEYDMGMRRAAETTRISARELGREAGHPEIVGWAYEMSAWFSLTQRRYREVQDAADAGQEAAPGGSAAAQLLGQRAKAYARLGDIGNVRDALGKGRKLLDSMARPARPEHHFQIDPDKWDFYAMDASRAAGDDDWAAAYARRVLAYGVAPMRMTEARLTLAVVDARAGELEKAVTTGIDALSGERKSLPSLRMVGGELDRELQQRYPDEPGTADFREALHAVLAGG